MDINKYKLLSDVAETQNFTKSAERLGYSQSGVSHILKGLEKEMGFPLFVRTRHGVMLTPNAETLLPLIRNILAETEKLQQTIYSIQGLEVGKLTIGTYSSISAYCLPPLLHAFKMLYPHIDIVLKEGGADDILHWLYTNRADIGFLSLPPHSKNLDWIELGNDPLMAVLPKDYPLTSDGNFPIAEFEKQPFIISAVGTDYDIHHALETCGVHPDAKYSSMDDHAIISMVMHHLGISILPRLMLTYYQDKVTALPLNPFFSRRLGMAMNEAQLPPAAKKFVEFARHNLKINPEQ